MTAFGWAALVGFTVAGLVSVAWQAWTEGGRR